MKKILAPVLGVLIILLVISISKDVIIKFSVESGIKAVTGLKLSIKTFRIGVFNTLVDIKGLKLFNPPAYKDKIMLDMPEIYVDYDLPGFFKGMIHMEEVRIALKEFVVVKNEKGEINLDSLKVVQAQKEGKKPEAKAAGKAPKVAIDVLDLKIGKVIYKDYSAGPTPKVREFNVNISERYTNITDPYALVSLIVVKALTNTAIGNLVNIDLRGLEGTISGTLNSAQKIAFDTLGTAGAKLGDTAAQAEKVLDTTTKSTGAVVKETEDALKKTTEGLTSIFGASKENK